MNIVSSGDPSGGRWKAFLVVLTLLVGLALLAFGLSFYVMRPKGPAGVLEPVTRPISSPEKANLQTLQTHIADLEALVREQQAEIDRFKDLSEHFDSLNALLAASSFGLVMLSLIVAVVGAGAWQALKKDIRDAASEVLKSTKDSLEAHQREIQTLKESSLRDLRDEGDKITSEAERKLDRVREDLSSRLSRALEDGQRELQARGQEITRSAQRQSERVREELSGRLIGAVGLVFGRLSRDEDEHLKISREDLLAMAIDQSRDAYQMLEKIDSIHKWKTMNNLAFYYALSGKDSCRQEALRLAVKLRRESLRTGKDLHFRTTYIRVIGQFPSLRDPEQALRRALAEVDDLLLNPDLRIRDRKEAEIYKGWLEEKLERTRAGGNGPKVASV